MEDALDSDGTSNSSITDEEDVSPGLTQPILNSRHFITPGVSKLIFDAIKKKSIPLQERLCVLLFNEIDLALHLDYLTKEDYIIGFEDTGWSRNKNVADTALVFMLRSIYGNWKQPVAFAFHDSPLNQKTLVRFIKTIAKETKNAGLNLIAMICTHADHNVETVDMLLEESKSVVLEGQEVVPIFDPSSLLLSTRNALSEAPLTFKKDGVLKTAKWEHLVKAHEIDRELSNCLTKITKSHLAPDSLSFTKCIQTLSGTFAGFLSTVAGKTGATLPPAATETAELLFFLDRVFDSLNGTMAENAEKPLRGPIRATSPHSKIWSEAKETFKDMDGKGGSWFGKWLRTLDAFEAIKSKMLALGYEAFPARSFHLEPLQNCFDLINEQAGNTPMENRLTCKKFSIFYNRALKAKDMAACRATEPICEPDGLKFLVTIEDLS
ncbi:uncharacterized protein LOC123011099 [Tribolium madens]|uniref:uncharacterized protein LOC123011099 n=1 Tax=Tribolium madens TaxID=41895 RepID=UPI001CF74192|nr:uncharacterized protein LOC123011099 [Tribolium madens]